MHLIVYDAPNLEAITHFLFLINVKIMYKNHVPKRLVTKYILN